MSNVSVINRAYSERLVVKMCLRGNVFCVGYSCCFSLIIFVFLFHKAANVTLEGQRSVIESCAISTLVEQPSRSDFNAQRFLFSWDKTR